MKSHCLTLAEQFARRRAEVDEIAAEGKVNVAIGTIMDRWSVTLAAQGLRRRCASGGDARRQAHRG